MGRAILLLTTGFVIITGIIGMSVNNRQKIIPIRNTNYFEENRVHNIANSLMDYAVAEVDENQDWQQAPGQQGGFSSNDFLGSSANVTIFTYNDYISNNPDIPEDHNIKTWNKFTILMVSKVEYNGFRSASEVALTKNSFSKYTYFTDEEADNIYFYSDDVLEGPVHTNGVLKIAGSPTFKGEVTSPNDWEGRDGTTNNPDFQGGTNFNHKPIELPSIEAFQNLKNAATSGGLDFNNDVFVEFKTQINGTDTLGTVDVSDVTGYTVGGEPIYGDPTNYDISTFNGVISSSEKIFTKGKVKGKVTLHSEKEVEIMGDLEYNTDPNQFASSTDLLGIVSEGNVILDKNAHTDHGSKDVTIQASILAIDASFKVEGYSIGNAKGTINLLGGLQQRRRGAVGTFNFLGISSGYSKAYSYDQRLLGLIPPAYPRESFFSKVYWKEGPVEKIGN